MDVVEEFEMRISIAAEEAKNCGFVQTYLALLEVLRLCRVDRKTDHTRAQTQLEGEILLNIY